MKTGFKTMK